MLCDVVTDNNKNSVIIRSKGKLRDLLKKNKFEKTQEEEICLIF